MAVTAISKISIPSLFDIVISNSFSYEGEFSNWISKYRNFLIAIISKYLQRLQVKTVYKNKALFRDLENLKQLILNTLFPQISSGTREFSKDSEYFCNSTTMSLFRIFLQMPLETKMPVKDLVPCQKSSEISSILGQLFLQKPFEKKILTNDSELLFELSEVSVSTTACDKNGSINLKSCQDNSRKFQDTCFLCQETIKKKKFFDEHRFGILSKCDCVICYGCIRKATCTDGVVKGPVCCPSCSVKSDIVAASAYWIEGNEKFKFFETYCKNMEFTNLVSNKVELNGLPHQGEINLVN